MILSFYRYSMLTLAVCLAVSVKIALGDDDGSFDQDFMNLPDNSGMNLDINTILKEKTLLPGIYPVSVFVNRQDFGQNNLKFTLKEGKLTPCVPVSLLRNAGVRESNIKNVDSAECVNVSESIDESSVNFDSQKLAVSILIPQKNLDQSVQGYIDPSKWDDGIPALLLNYSASGARTTRNNATADSANIYLDGGLNLYGFRFRSSASWRKGSDWEKYNTYVEKDLPGTMGNIQAGEVFTGGDVLESVPLRGIQLGSVVQMLPDSLQGYSPVIRGVANTQAKVEISQHGYSLYTTWVPPGPFEIRDLNTASGNGDLDVTITESDGTVRHFTQPFATLGNLLRRGTWRYNIAMGEYKSTSSGSYNSVSPRFVQASGALGMAHDITLSTGFTFSDMYQTGVVGLGKSLGSLGALALDVSQSKTRYSEHQESGQSYSIRYGKAFNSGTNLRFAGYRYSTEGYRTFSEAVNERSYINQYNAQQESRRNRIEATLTQNIGESSSLYLTANQQTWWRSSRKTRQLQLGFNTMIEWVSVGLYASRTREDGRYGNNRSSDFSLMLSLPFGKHSISSTISRDENNQYTENLGLSGIAGEKNQFNYNLNLRNQQQGKSNDYVASAGYLSPWGQLNGGVSAGSHYHTENVGVTGAILAHSGGIELSQRLGDTVGLIDVDNTPGVSLQNSPTSVTNSRGYALVPYLRPYRANRILLDVRNVENDVDIDGRVQQVYPRQGAVVAIHYKARKSRRLLVQLARPDGSYVPFGASISDISGKELTLVGQAGQGLINLEQGVATMALDISWGSKADQKCRAEVKVNGLPQEDGLSMAKTLCR